MIVKQDSQNSKAHAIIFPELESWVRSQVQIFIQDILEQEVTELLGRDKSERRQEDAKRRHG
ncbi:MAG TPA: hypothetical protein VNN73_00495 [Blastocatellia bacterium]|nr:hypothetical protein [Blastocatellia bacterium]